MRTNDSVEDYRAKADEQFSRLAMNLDSPAGSQIARPPWEPKVSGRIAFFFGPVAGALVVVISLRRMGHRERAKTVMLLALGIAVAEGLILAFIPEVLSRLVSFAAEIVFLLIFPPFMEKEFAAWESSHPDVKPASGWRAIGWGFLGATLFLVILLLVFLGVGALLPQS